MGDPYYARYTAFDAVFLNRRLLSIKSLHEQLLADQEAIGFQLWLSDEVAKLSRKYRKEWIPNLQKQTAHIFYNRNIHYLYAALEHAVPGLCDPCYNSLRTVYESILKMYYLWANTSDARNVNKDMDNPKQPKYNHNFLIQYLYSKPTQDSMRKFFHEISAKAHSSYTGVGTTFEYSPKQVKDCFDAILVLSFYNITAEVENQSSEPSILEDRQVKALDTYLEKLRKLLVDEQGTIPAFLPDKPNLWKRLGIKPDLG